MPGKNGQIAGSALVRDSRERREGSSSPRISVFGGARGGRTVAREADFHPENRRARY